ncbi:MAG: DinB family protein [Caldilineaceae bacterium]|nr:DinB family protein [Caldilineaceae bacterium]
MLDFAALRNKTMTLNELVDGLTVDDLRNETDEMIDAMLAMIADSVDADVTFVPQDPEANDTFAATPEEVGISWTLGHLVVHVTASSEEAAALAAELARGVPLHGRSRSEIPWQEMKSIAQCRARFEESRRMRHASLDMWPDSPYLDLMDQSRPDTPPINAIGRFVRGLSHDFSHLAQIEDVVAQAKVGR